MPTATSYEIISLDPNNETRTAMVSAPQQLSQAEKDAMVAGLNAVIDRLEGGEPWAFHPG